MTTGVGGGTRSRVLRTDLFLVLAVLALTAPILREWSSQPASRYLYTVAVVDQQALELDRYHTSLGVDYAQLDEHYYSDKAPYQPIGSAPVYWAYRAAGGDAFPEMLPGPDVGASADVGVWLVTMWSSAIPAAILVVLMHRFVRRTHPDVAAATAAALSLGTVMLPFSSLLFGHLLAALTGFAAWFLIRREAPSSAALVGAGLLLGAGIGVEYPQVVVGAVVGITAIVLHRNRAAWVALGGFVGILPLLVVNAITFGGPFKTAYQGHLPNFQGTGAFGVYNLVLPDPREFGLALIGDRGLFSLTPIMIVALLGCALAIRRRTPARLDAIVALVLLALFLLISTGIDGYGGSSPGPRYLVPILPFFALPLAEGWRRWRPLAVVTAIWSAVWMVLASFVNPLYENNEIAVVSWIRDLFDGEVARTIPNEVVGGPSAVVFVVAAAVFVALAIRTSRGDDGAPGPGRAPERTPAAPPDRVATTAAG